MTDHKKLLRQAQSLVIFRSLLNDKTVSKLLAVIHDIEKNDTDKAINDYSEFISGLYVQTDNLTQYILKLILESENLYIIKKAREIETGAMLDECLENELEIISKLAQIKSDDIRSSIGYDGFLPSYTTEELDFADIYNDRILHIKQKGYGIYSKYHMFMLKSGQIVPVEYPDDISLKQLSGYERERQEVIDNTVALIKGKPANNVLLYGDCGTGKSSTVKAIANEYTDQGLRLIELKKKQLHHIPHIVETISKNPLKFIVFIDDLSFTEDDDDFAALKAILEGSVSSTASNLAIYATSNRRHLVKETFSARQGDEIHINDTMQEVLSLSDRFGLKVTFQKPDKYLYLSVTEDLAKQYDLKIPLDELKTRAEAFALSHGGRSPRTAKQFIEYLKGCEE